MVAARLLRLSVSSSLRASPRCAAETRSKRTSPLTRLGCAAETRSGKDRGLMRAAETRSKGTSPLTRMGCVSVAAPRFAPLSERSRSAK